LRGKPVYSEEGCVGCGACREVCPAGAIDVTDLCASDGRSFRRLTLHYDRCIFCGECVRACTTGEGVSLSADYELSGFDRASMVQSIDKELVQCELCGEAIATRAHLLWIYRRLGARAFSNPTLFLLGLEELGLRDPVVRDGGPICRGDIQRTLCPACRRAVTQREEWGPV